MAALALPAFAVAAEPGAIKGTVTGEGHGGLADVQVCAWDETQGVEGCVKSEVGGAYEIPDLPAGEYLVEFWPAGLNYVWEYYGGSRSVPTPVTVAGGETKSGIDAELEAGATISGVVSAAATGLPASEVIVCAFKQSEFVYGCDLTDGSGSYAITGLAGGQYEVEFQPENFRELVGQDYSLGLVTVQPHAATTGINQALVATGQITGTVRLAATGAPLSGVRVCVTEAEFLETLGCVTTSASGGYRFTGFWPGTVKIVFSAEATEFPDQRAVADAYPTQWWNGASTFATATPIQTAPPAIISGIDASLGPPASPVVPAPVVPVTPVSKAIKKPKPLKCRKGAVKRKLHGKVRCVRRHTATKHRHRHKKPA